MDPLHAVFLNLIHHDALAPPGPGGRWRVAHARGRFFGSWIKRAPPCFYLLPWKAVIVTLQMFREAGLSSRFMSPGPCCFYFNLFKLFYLTCCLNPHTGTWPWGSSNGRSRAAPAPSLLRELLWCPALVCLCRRPHANLSPRVETGPVPAPLPHPTAPATPG